MAFCPADHKPCIDDLCYGGGCLALGGEPMLDRCHGCGQLVPVDGSDSGDCECEPDYDDDDRDTEGNDQ